MGYVIARDQYYLDNEGRQFVRGYAATSVVGRGRTLKRAAESSGGWFRYSGYRAFDSVTGECFGTVDQPEPGVYTTEQD